MATKIDNPIIRRVRFSTPLYEIVEIAIHPATEIAPEILELSTRNRRQDPEVTTMPLEDAMRYLFSDHWGSGDSEDTPDHTPSGSVSVKGLEDAIMIHGDFTANEKSRFFNLVREVQAGER